MDEPLQSDLDPLIGSWRLESLGITWSDTGERWDYLGPNPVGWMMLNASGRVMFLFTKANRQAPSSDADRAGLFEAMTAYTGTVNRDGEDRFVTTVDLALNPAYRGEQVRFFARDGDRLTIWTPEQTFPQFGDRRLVVDVVWIRER